MSIALVTGSAGLIGSETSKRFHAEGYDIVGVDNDMRAKFFGAEASTALTRTKLEKSLKNYRHEAVDIRDTAAVNAVFITRTTVQDSRHASAVTRARRPTGATSSRRYSVRRLYPVSLLHSPS